MKWIAYLSLILIFSQFITVLGTASEADSVIIENVESLEERIINKANPEGFQFVADPKLDRPVGELEIIRGNFRPINEKEYQNRGSIPILVFYTPYVGSDNVYENGRRIEYVGNFYISVSIAQFNGYSEYVNPIFDAIVTVLNDSSSGPSDETDWSSLLTYVKGKNSDLAKLNDDAIIEGLKKNPDLVKEIIETIMNEKALKASFEVNPVNFDAPFSYEKTDWGQYFLGKVISQINPVSVYSSDTHEVEAEFSDLWEIYKMYGSGSTEELEGKVQDFIVDKIYGLTGPIASLREANSVMVNIRNDNFINRMEQERISYINDVHTYLNNAGNDWKNINAVKDAKEKVYEEHTLKSSVNQYADIAGVEGLSSAEIEEIMKESLMAAFDVDLAAKRLTDKDIQGSTLIRYEIEKVDPLTDKLLNVVNPCISPMVWDKDSRSCVCGSGYQNEGGTCVAISCPENEVWNEEAQGCYCIQGFKRSSYGHCVPEDKVHEYQDGSG